MLEPPLLWMPVHLLSMVLCQLDNTTSLASAIFSHSSLYAAWMEDRHRIVRTVLRNQIPPAVEPYVFLTHLAGSPDVDHDDLSQLRRFLTRHIYFTFKFTSPPREALFSKSNPVDIRLASSLSRTHAIVEHFTKHFVQDTLPVTRKELGLRGKQGATDDEVFRIQRAMYRYQMYCNLFGHPYDSDKRRRLEAPLSVRFFGPYSPWVNEQLAAVHDYFERVLSRAFDEVAAHDVEWGYKSINWLTVANRNEHKQGYLFRGLDFLHKLDQAKAYSERRELLGDSPPQTRHMLGTMFYKCGSNTAELNGWGYFWDHIDNVMQDGRRWVDNHWPSSGPDMYGSGPFRMWRAAHADCWQQNAIFHVDHAWLRRCGYVFWDFPEAVFTDDELRARILQGRQKAWLDRFRRNDGQLKGRIKRSRRERAGIFRRGGRGYWSEGDLSRVIWTRGAPS